MLHDQDGVAVPDRGEAVRNQERSHLRLLGYDFVQGGRDLRSLSVSSALMASSSKTSGL